MYYSATKHKTFISFYHKDDQKYKNFIDAHFSDKIINKSVMDGEYNSDNSDEYIKRLIREDKISDSSVIVVLVGANTKHRKHVDWEIYAGLRSSNNGRSGLVGIILPEIQLPNNQYRRTDLPGRLADNVSSGYANLYPWEYAMRNFETIVDEAYDNRILLAARADNSRLQMTRNGN